MNNDDFSNKTSQIQKEVEEAEHARLVKHMASLRESLKDTETARLRFAISPASFEDRFGDDLDLVSVLKKNDALDPDGDFADSVLGVWNQNRDFYHTKTLECYTTFGGAYPIEWSDEDWAVLADAEDKGEVFILAFYVDDEGYWVEPLSCDGRGSHSIT